MSVYTGESRGELLAWLNDLLGATAPAKVEECGKGYTYCQILDSVYGDIPMARVKFNARMEYEYLENFKILQKGFKTHRIDKPILVDKLVKCKMQDNLEFLQWMKKFWDANARGDEYNAAGRTGGVVPPSAPSSSRAPAARPAGVSRTAGVGAARSGSAASTGQLNDLREQVAEMQAHCETVERERDFYFDKLRQIELIVQQRSGIEGLETGEKDMIGQIQEILYSTAEGFELPDNEAAQAPADEETF
ncbi:calponin homology domain-containing protein [Kockovaella imperatae]|uniref:Calponin homology domain-containing protein n=1 Tax=Kockovaella imperatae TaxID=4999 RepID=A0A1Y1U8G1_9TREE|nr:calponin homology domain-containing protein [Kockovaella imperatae]ORX33824.1 calponin homology domain-containing protein [Kockovaella imperatae]